MAFAQPPDTLTQREREQFEQEKALIELQSQHTLRLKELELQLERETTKWSNIQKIPLYIVKLPVYCLFGVAYIVAIIRKTELSEDFWKFMK